MSAPAASPVAVLAFQVVGALRRPGLGTLDTITVIVRDYGPGQFQVIVECYGRAWSAHWGSTGRRDAREFFSASDAGYLANCLLRGARAAITNRRAEAREAAYLIDIVRAIKAAWPAPKDPT